MKQKRQHGRVIYRERDTRRNLSQLAFDIRFEREHRKKNRK
jgi:hypothetical protein